LSSKRTFAGSSRKRSWLIDSLKAAVTDNHTREVSSSLAGMHVVSLALNVPGPVAARHLLMLGARVTKVEPPTGDPLSLLAPDWYLTLHHDQNVRRLDLRRPDDVAELHTIVSSADLLLTSQRQRVLDRLELTGSRLRARHPDVCHVAIVGYAPPEADVPGHDLTYLARAGLIDAPRMPRTLIVDLAGAERAAMLAVSLILERERYGRAGECRVALGAVAHELAAPLRHGLTRDIGPLGGGSPGYRIYRAREGWVALGAVEPHFGLRLCRLFGLEQLERNDLERVFLTRSAREWAAWGVLNEIPLAEVAGTG
jgi:alpha-methylacyl-CoA racemase